MFVIKQKPVKEQQVMPNGLNSVSYDDSTTTNIEKNTSYLQYSDIPEIYRSEIITKFIKPIETKFNRILINLQTYGTKEANEIITKTISVINGHLNDIYSNIENLKLAEAHSGISNIGIKGFDEIKLKMDKGLQLNITPDSENYNVFFNIIRKYVFNYRGSEWPPDINKYQYFEYDNPEKELCCFYWPLYGYIKTLFHNDFRGQVELTDLFSLQKMRSYCNDFFPKKELNSTLNLTQKIKKDNKKKKAGGGNGPKSIPNNKPKSIPNNKPKRLLEKSGIHSDTSTCNNLLYFISKKALEISKISLKKTNLDYNIKGLKISNNEYNALNLIVKTHIRKTINDNGNGLIINNMSVQDFLNKHIKYDQSITISNPEDKNNIYNECKNKSFEIFDETPVFIEPFTKTIFKYGEIKKWFPLQNVKKNIEKRNKDGKVITTTSGQTIMITEIINYNNYCNIIQNAVLKFKYDYNLISPMWKLQQDELNGVKTRFLKILTFLLVSLKEMYEQVKRENSKKNSKKKEENKIKVFYYSLLKDIENEKNSSKIQKMVKLKDDVEAKFGYLLK